MDPICWDSWSNNFRTSDSSDFIYICHPKPSLRPLVFAGTHSFKQNLEKIPDLPQTIWKLECCGIQQTTFQQSCWKVGWRSSAVTSCDRDYWRIRHTLSILTPLAHFIPMLSESSPTLSHFWCQRNIYTHCQVLDLTSSYGISAPMQFLRKNEDGARKDVLSWHQDKLTPCPWGRQSSTTSEQHPTRPCCVSLH